MQFFRVETSDRIGPYVGVLASINSVANIDYARQPGPNSDDGLHLWKGKEVEDRRVYIFGFISLNQLFNWFYREEEIAFLKNHGYHLSVYEAPDSYVIASSYQAVAHADHLTLVNTLDF